LGALRKRTHRRARRALRALESRVISAAVNHIANQLNLFLKRTFDSAEDIVVVSNLVEQDGTLAPNTNNRLCVFLVNVEKDSTAQRANGGGVGLSRVVGYPPVYLNLYVMVAAHFGQGNYGEALKFISATMAFFQGRPVLDHSNTPDLDDDIERLVLDIENLTITDLSNLWGILSGHYLPSVLYKVRMVAFDGGDVRRMASTVRAPDTSAQRGG
jgi:hypothetical protein